MRQFSIIRPFDAHVHLRSGDLLKTVIPYTTSIFSNAVAMGNLADPVDNLDKVLLYWKEIIDSIPVGDDFVPVMSVMLNKNSTPEIIDQVAGIAKVLKFIPGATSTNSEMGISFFDLCDPLKKYYKVLERAQENNMIFSVHVELINDANGNTIHELHREREAIQFLEKIIADFPKLKIVVEHVSTAEVCQLVTESPENVTATVTLHHLLLSIHDVYGDDGKIENIFNYCKPVAKSFRDTRFISQFIFSGNKKFFFGSDSAPHLISDKLEKSAAGIFTAPIALQKLAEIFDSAGNIGRLENFVSIYGREFYGLPIPEKKITLFQEEYEYPEEIGGIKVFSFPSNKLKWKIK